MIIILSNNIITINIFIMKIIIFISIYSNIITAFPFFNFYKEVLFYYNKNY